MFIQLRKPAALQKFQWIKLGFKFLLFLEWFTDLNGLPSYFIGRLIKIVWRTMFRCGVGLAQKDVNLSCIFSRLLEFASLSSASNFSYELFLFCRYFSDFPFDVYSLTVEFCKRALSSHATSTFTCQWALHCVQNYQYALNQVLISFIGESFMLKMIVRSYYFIYGSFSNSFISLFFGFDQ